MRNVLLSNYIFLKNIQLNIFLSSLSFSGPALPTWPLLPGGTSLTRRTSWTEGRTGSLIRREAEKRTVDVRDLYTIEELLSVINTRPTMKEVEKNVILPNYHVLRDQQIMLIYNMMIMM